MANFNMPWEEEQDPATVTPIAGGNPTQEEAEKAFEKLFEESRNAFYTWFTEVWS